MTTNLYERLMRLVPSTPLLIAEVVETRPDGTSLVEFPGGSRQVVRGTSVPVGQPAFILGDAIDSAAPARTATVIEV